MYDDDITTDDRMGLRHPAPTPGGGGVHAMTLAASGVVTRGGGR